MAIRYCSAVLALLAVAAPLAAQSHPLVGTWAVEMQDGVKVVDGQPEPIMGKGTMVFSIRNDSLVAVITMEANEMVSGRPPMKFAAKLVDGPAVFIKKGKAVTMSNGAQEEVEIVSTFRFEAKGDALVGSVERNFGKLENPMAGTSPITGTRVRTS